MKPSPEELKTTCDFCGAEFIPSADSFCDGGIEMCDESLEPLTEADLKERADVRQALKADHGFTDDQVDEAMGTGRVEGMVWCVCDKCLEKGAEPEKGEEWKEGRDV